MNARDEILRRLGDAPPDAAAYDVIPRPYLRRHHDGDVVGLFAERAADYRAEVRRIAHADLPGVLGALRGRYLAPNGLPAPWTAGLDAARDDPQAPADRPDAVRDDPQASADGLDVAGAAPQVSSGGLDGVRDNAQVPSGGLEIVRDDPPVSIAELDALDGVITGCAVAIAETGTVVLDHGPGQGRRAVTLVPDHHVVVVEAARIAADVPEALERLSPDRPLTFVSGPSATSDIELSRVEGVHGPRRLTIVIID
ncbi:LutC/YkgG family protein [Actinoallomurus sp. CA-150999]|uniref:LutC/YkgG family protein n=1 Tax=Actinoallomurus sp. CA-150999 TaxID=3239887 RepID=UPI003D8CE81A